MTATSLTQKQVVSEPEASCHNLVLYKEGRICWGLWTRVAGPHVPFLARGIVFRGGCIREGTTFPAFCNSVASLTAMLASLASFAHDARQVCYFSSAWNTVKLGKHLFPRKTHTSQWMLADQKIVLRQIQWSMPDWYRIKAFSLENEIHLDVLH